MSAHSVNDYPSRFCFALFCFVFVTSMCDRKSLLHLRSYWCREWGSIDTPGPRIEAMWEGPRYGGTEVCLLGLTCQGSPLRFHCHSALGKEMISSWLLVQFCYFRIDIRNFVKCPHFELLIFNDTANHCCDKFCFH